MTTLNKSKIMVCCFCNTEVEIGTVICFRCGEYKGIMTLADFEKHYGEFGGF